MPSKKNRIPVLPGKAYHIYNRGNNYEKVFFNQEDYKTFLNKIKEYLLNYVDVYAYALIDNHFHWAIRVKDKPFISFANEYSKFILHYTNKVNFEQKRSGSLFLNPFKRIEIENEEYLKRLVFYIHYNPEKHKLTSNYKLYPFSSYQAFLSNKPSGIDRDYVLNIYGSKDEFREYHQYLSNLNGSDKFSLED